ncbi:MAG TPA: hypothetical protein VFQ52_06055 [Rhizomicrobium sp.]|nr:hypothetical protein [Rhizomicrobium sp.]
MRVTTPLENSVRGGSKTFVAVPRVIEKTSASSALNTQSDDREHHRGKTPLPLRVELVCQSETIGFDPFWDGPRLLPIFVAQVLGQVMPEHRDIAAMAHAAYDSAAPRTYGAGAPKTGLLVDRKS